MRIPLNMRHLIFGLLLFTLYCAVGTTTAFASTLTLSPAKSSVANGATVSLQVTANAGAENVNGVTAVISYPQDKLTLTGIDYAGTAFPQEWENGQGNPIRISRTSTSGVTGSVKVATIRFKTKAEGTADISIGGGSAITRTNDASDSLTGSSGATITVTKAAVAAKPSGTVTPSTAPVTKPTISGIKSTSTSLKSGLIEWTTNIETDSVVKFGTEKDKYVSSASSETLTKKHSITVSSENLVPGATLHFKIISTDKDGNSAESTDQEFMAKGYVIVVTVKDNQGKPVTNTAVELHSDPKTAVTDENGMATFENVEPGKHSVIVKLAGGDQSQEVTVDETNPTQNIVVLVVKATQPGWNNPLLWLGGVVLVLIAVGLLLRKKLSSHSPQ
jgi:hypothetical protein